MRKCRERGDVVVQWKCVGLAFATMQDQLPNAALSHENLG